MDRNGKWDSQFPTLNQAKDYIRESNDFAKACYSIIDAPICTYKKPAHHKRAKR